MNVMTKSAPAPAKSAPRSGRRSGVLAHVTSLPGRYGMGELGSQARRFVDWLAAARQSVWQVLPLSPAAGDGCPYSAMSSAAGDARLVSIEGLLEDGLLSATDVADLDALGAGPVDYARAYPLRARAVRTAAQRLLARGPGDAERAAFERFRAQAGPEWLEDFALFAALKEAHGQRAWPYWARPLATRDPDAIAEAVRVHAPTIEAVCAEQYLFARDWARLAEYARARGVRLFGDMPIYVSHDSVDVWRYPELFRLDADGQPITVAGCPPDGFSPDGQRWGNPIYAWERHAEQGYAWWIWRMRRMAELCDIVRIDHFRAFAGYYEIPASAPTAATGEWRAGPGASIFEALTAALPHVEIVAEDLGHITPDVYALRDAFDMPGMKILQFELENAPFAPDQIPTGYPKRSVAYVGTHDNPTAEGWFATLGEPAKAAIFALAGGGASAADALTRILAQASSDLVVHQMQDLLGLPAEARMNVPGTTVDNWRWRFEWAPDADDIAERLARLTLETGRA